MDPATILAITGACVGITRNAASFITGLNDLVVRMRDVELDLSSIEAQTGILGLVSERLRLWINIHQDELTQVERSRLWACVNSCDQFVRALETATHSAGREPATVGAPEPQRRLGLWRRAQTLIAQPQLQRYATALQQQGNALNTFLQLFQSTAPATRPAALQNKRTSIIIDKAINSACKNSSEIRNWLQTLEVEEGGIPGRDSGFGDDSSNASSNASSNRTTGSARASHASSGPHANSLSLQNLRIHNEAQGDRRRAGLPTAPRPSTPDPRQPDIRSYSSSPTRNIRHAAAPGAPGDSPPPSDLGDNDSVTTVRDRDRGTPQSSLGSSSPPPSINRQSVYDVRDELERMSEASSNPNQTGSVIENIRSDLVRLQEILLELIIQEGGIAPELESHIERLFEQVRNNLRAAGNEDERILRGTNVHIRNTSGETALHIAVRKRPVDLAAIRKFLNLGASVRELDNRSNTPLLTLVSTNYNYHQEFDDAVSLLLDRGSDINARSVDGWTALSRVSSTSDCVTLVKLINRGANVNTTTLPVDLLTPLHRAAKIPSAFSVELLLSNSANPNAISTSGETPLSLVCQLSFTYCRAQATIVELLLTAGARPTGGPPGAKKPLDALIKVLKEKEQRLSLNVWSTNNIGTFSTDRAQFEQNLYTINVLLKYMSTITLHYSTRALARGMYAFRQIENIEGIPIAELRRRFRERVGELVVPSNRELYQELRRFHNLPVQR